MQPIFSSSYYEGLILPAREGGLDVPQVLRFKFNEGGGAALFETVNEMKARIGASGGRAMPEPLRQFCTSCNTSTDEPQRCTNPHLRRCRPPRVPATSPPRSRPSPRTKSSQQQRLPVAQRRTSAS